ncbi:Cholesterol oxidase [BD1-7 clade bacterium]|uniref:Cholesterol oxidase n=1 Tax=BD1-7 clade bacterium TaxID=2029982 RepID=A0A5S9PL22_9GAMM|nr:Cholesterol oxidase [BD1-7 clade bacterium]CAA0104990.1 Cholesterol oxidase [BD1-7 clade bacterium]
MDNNKISRRSFIKAGAVTTAAAGAAPALAHRRRPRKAIIIGSGFGGAVSALRLAEKGVETLVLERGRFWENESDNPFPGIFPTIKQPDARTSWLQGIDPNTGTPLPKYTGLIERFESERIATLVGAGVGGGSLVYGGSLLQPKQKPFEDAFPRFVNYDLFDQYYYPLVRQMMNAGQIPDDILASSPYTAMRNYTSNMEASGFDVERGFTGFDWDIVRKELTGEEIPAATIGEFNLCNSNAKNTLGKNYLKYAQETGKCEIRALHQVANIEEDYRGGYCVHVEKLDDEGNVIDTETLQSDLVIMAAGSMNTTKLMLKAKRTGSLWRLNRWVGKKWGNNGDKLYLRATAEQDNIGDQGGPISMTVFDLDNPIKPVTVQHAPGPGLFPFSGLNHLIMTVPDRLGRLRYKVKTDELQILWPEDAETQSIEAGRLVMDKVNATVGGQQIPLPTIDTTYHPLGGMPIGKATDRFGRVKGYRGLIVADGSLLHGSAGCANPALTIAALVEHNMDFLINYAHIA